MDVVRIENGYLKGEFLPYLYYFGWILHLELDFNDPCQLGMVTPTKFKEICLIVGDCHYFFLSYKRGNQLWDCKDKFQ